MKTSTCSEVPAALLVIACHAAIVIVIITMLWAITDGLPGGDANNGGLEYISIPVLFVPLMLVVIAFGYALTPLRNELTLMMISSVLIGFTFYVAAETPLIALVTAFIALTIDFYLSILQVRKTKRPTA